MYPSIGDPNFELLISRKAEFKKSLDLGYLKPHQELVRRYMSPYTPYDRLLVYHNMGSGKSYIAISIADDHYTAMGRKCIVLTKGSTAANNFKLQIAMWLRVKNPSISNKDIKEYISARYVINHYLRFCKTKLVGKINPDICSNIVLVIDEVHNINYGRDNVYNNLRLYIRSLTNSKVLLLSGTPMTNDISRMISITEMILPESATEDMIKTSESFYDIIRGYISYYDTGDEEVTVSYKGAVLDEFFVPVYISQMVGIQAEVYKRFVYNDSIYVNQTHIASFVFSDGSYGSNAFNSKIISSKFKVPCFVGALMKERKYNYSCVRYRICEEYHKDIRYETLVYHSAKYYNIITEINRRHNELCFIFSKDIRGSGLIILSCILESMGYELYYGQDIEDIHPKLRYTICVGVSYISPNNKDRIAGYNHYLNRYGDYVKVMLGSSVTGECISLFNVRHLHCVSPHWNTSYIEQVVKRVVRTGSHNMLKPHERTVDVYIHLSILDSYTETVDMRKLGISNRKELELEPVRSSLRISSIESILSKYKYNDIDLDCSTFVYYIDKLIMTNYTETLAKYLVYPTNLYTLVETLNIPVYLAKYILNYMIQYNTPVRDYYGRISYVREADSIITLTHNYRSNAITIDNVSQRLFYNIEHIQDKDFDVNSFIYSNEKMHPILVIEEMSKLSWNNRIRVLERAIENNSKICAAYSIYIIVRDTYYHIYEYRRPIQGRYNSTSRHFNPRGLTRVFIDGIWQNASYEDELLAFAMYESRIDRLEANSRDILYIYSTIDSILRVSISELVSNDRRTIKRGRDINTLSKQELEICYYTIYNYSVSNICKSELIYYIVLKLLELDMIIYF